MTSTRNAHKRDATGLPIFLVCVAAILLSLTQVFAGEADVVGVMARHEAAGTWRFDVTLRHGDEGWDHYADKWEVTGADGTVYGERGLAHPHETEQPFTRSLGGISIPESVATVQVRAHDSVHGFGGAEMTVDLGPLR